MSNRFRCILAAHRADRHTQAMGQAGRLRVVLVEDRRDIREVVPLMLARADLDCEPFATAEEAIAAAGAATEAPALLITDANLDDGTAREVVDAWLERFSELRVLVTSGRTAEELMTGGVIYPGDPFLPKPFTLADFLATVRALVSPLRDVA